jgi:peptidase E
MGGGGFSMEPDNSLLDEFVLSLARSSQPRVCFLPTASGDADSYTVRFYRAFATLFDGETLSEVVASRPEAAGYRVAKTTDSLVTEQRIPARYLGTGATASAPAG